MLTAGGVWRRGRMTNGAVLLLDDDDDLRESLAELVLTLGAPRCLALAGVAELVARRDDAVGCALAVLDLNLGPSQPSGLDAYAWLRRERFTGAIVFLTGHARGHPLVTRAEALRDARLYRKPIEIAELREILDVAASLSP